MRYWSAAHTPLTDAEGRTLFIVQNTVDVTELQQLRTIAYGPAADEPTSGAAALLQRAQDVEAANQLLTRETQALRDLFMQAPGFIAVLSGPELTFTLVNKAYQRLIGERPVIGRSLAEAIPEVVEQGFVDILRGVLDSGQAYEGVATPLWLSRSPGGPLEERFVDFVYQPITSPDGEISGVFVEGSDVTARVLAERQQKLLVDELNHRVKNTLATVQAIAAQTVRTTPDPAAFREAFESRLLALSTTHDILTATQWRSAPLRDVLRAEFRPYDPSRYRFSGPDVNLSPAEALALALLVHELATNAAKYGALSIHDGCVEVAWRVEDGRLSLSWRERGGPAVSEPIRRGFGSRLIERSLKELGGQAALHYRPAGLVCDLSLVLRQASGV
jgi:two-component sensor histidine kinase